jgi:hypothetical protein
MQTFNSVGRPSTVPLARRKPRVGEEPISSFFKVVGNDAVPCALFVMPDGMMRESPIRCSTKRTSRSQLTVWMSPSTMKFTFLLVIQTHSASCVPRPGQNPYENPRHQLLTMDSKGQRPPVSLHRLFQQNHISRTRVRHNFAVTACLNRHDG